MLAEQTRAAYGLDGQVHLDQHLTPPAGGLAQRQALADRSTIDQAIGALIEQGHPLEDAHAELRRRSHHHGSTLAEAAAATLNQQRT